MRLETEKGRGEQMRHVDLSRDELDPAVGSTEYCAHKDIFPSVGYLASVMRTPQVGTALRGEKLHCTSLHIEMHILIYVYTDIKGSQEEDTSRVTGVKSKR